MVDRSWGAAWGMFQSREHTLRNSSNNYSSAKTKDLSESGRKCTKSKIHHRMLLLWQTEQVLKQQRALLRPQLNQQNLPQKLKLPLLHRPAFPLKPPSVTRSPKNHQTIPGQGLLFRQKIPHLVLRHLSGHLIQTMIQTIIQKSRRAMQIIYHVLMITPENRIRQSLPTELELYQSISTYTRLASLRLAPC